MDETLDTPTRRAVLAGLGTAAMISIAGAQQASPPSDSSSHNVSDKPPTDPGPKNPPIKEENPDSWSPPSTDSGD
ncbi:MAG TPA: hypothetical protein VG326_14235, partial [Tepidisphaeraceae bacterium]|nr:hypothetical protein [Tepidisphaeraceae bacterium]